MSLLFYMHMCRNGMQWLNMKMSEVVKVKTATAILSEGGEEIPVGGKEEGEISMIQYSACYQLIKR